MPVGGMLMAARRTAGRGGAALQDGARGAREAMVGRSRGARDLRTVAPVARRGGRDEGSAGEAAREQVVAEMQRSRLLGAAVRVLEDQGYEHATVAHITSRARVSRRTFYELFANREQCIAALLHDTAGRIEAELRGAGLARLSWREQIRAGLWAILCFLEREPELARVLVVHALRGSGPVPQARDEIVGRLVAAVDQGRAGSAPAAGCSELTAEGVVGATLAILYRRLAQRRGRPAPLTGLLGELTATVLLPYLGPAVARREQARPAPATVSLTGARTERPEGDPLQGLPMRLTYRTARVLEGVGCNPGASNRQLADYAGIQDQGQVSKLLARLESLGLLRNQSAGRAKGEPNRWSLTPRGALVARSIAPHATTGGGEGGSRRATRAEVAR